MNRIQYIAGFVKKHDWAKGAEIGVWRGQFFFGILEACPKLYMVGVDPWIVLVGDGNKESTGFHPYETWNIEEGGNKFRIGCQERFGDRTKIYHMPSLQGAEKVQDNSLDFVQIDADHRTSFVRADVAAWYPKVKVGGRIFGHDWVGFKSVKKAVSTFKDLEVNEDANIWSIPKRKGLWP